MTPSTFVVYSRPGCHLCEQLVEELQPLVCNRSVIEVRNIEDREQWLEAYFLRIPVLELDGEVVCEGQLDRAAVHAALRRVGEDVDSPVPGRLD